MTPIQLFFPLVSVPAAFRPSRPQATAVCVLVSATTTGDLVCIWRGGGVSPHCIDLSNSTVVYVPLRCPRRSRVENPAGSAGAIYGELTIGGMQKVVNVLKVLVLHAFAVELVHRLGTQSPVVGWVSILTETAPFLRNSCAS